MTRPGRKFAGVRSPHRAGTRKPGTANTQAGRFGAALLVARSPLGGGQTRRQPPRVGDRWIGAAILVLHLLVNIGYRSSRQSRRKTVAQRSPKILRRHLLRARMP